MKTTEWFLISNNISVCTRLHQQNDRLVSERYQVNFFVRGNNQVHSSVWYHLLGLETWS